MNEREALKLALVALETGGWNKTTAAITALREALAEQSAQQRPQNCGTGYCSCIECPYEQPAQRQEPGRNHWEDGDVFERIAAMKKQPAQQQEPVAVYVGETWCGSVVRLYDDLPLETPLYTSPPASKPWVGLTEQEIEKLAVESGKATFLNDDEQTDILWFDGDCVCLARAIEAKLKEKNNG